MKDNGCRAKDRPLEVSRRSFMASAAACAPLPLAAHLAVAGVEQQATPKTSPDIFPWQFPSADKEATWKNYSFSIDRWWGDFSHSLPEQMNMFADNPWAVGPFTKYERNPILAPTSGAWDQGHFSGGVHNGSVIVRDGKFYYLYRGERPLDIPQKSAMDYICDIGVAVSTDGIHFTKDSRHSPFFRKGTDRQYSYEDVSVVRKGDTYYLFCNQWLWERQEDPGVSGIIVATSTDLNELDQARHGFSSCQAHPPQRCGTTKP